MDTSRSNHPGSGHDTKEQKDQIRRRVKAQKALLDAAERDADARAVFDMLEKTAAFMLADHVMVYHSLPDELPTPTFIDRWAERKQFYLPRVNGVNLDVLPYRKSRLHLGAFQIEEPDGDDVVDFSTIEVVIVPAVAYDRRGNRLGRGKGFYDRLLSTGRGPRRAVTIGVCHEFQLVDDIPADEHDVPVDIVVTPHRIIYTRRSKK